MGHTLVYDRFDLYMGDSIYICPCCGKQYYTWELWRRAIEEGDTFECDRCKILLTYR